MSALKTQLSLFTIIPVNVSGDDVDYASKHFWLVPLIGLFYGLLAGGLFFLLTRVFGGLVSAVIVILFVHMLNRFLHFDGLIDIGDGLVATGPPEKKLAAMKDTRVGAGGVSYGIMFMLLIVAALASIPALFFFVPLAMEVLAKNGLFTVAALGKEREGLGSPFVKNSEPSMVVLSSLLSVVLILPFALLSTGGAFSVLEAAVLSAALVAVSVAAGAVLSWVAVRNFGCVNGDVLGATNEMTKAAVLLAALAVLSWML